MKEEGLGLGLRAEMFKRCVSAVGKAEIGRGVICAFSAVPSQRSLKHCQLRVPSSSFMCGCATLKMFGCIFFCYLQTLPGIKGYWPAMKSCLHFCTFM